VQYPVTARRDWQMSWIGEHGRRRIADCCHSWRNTWKFVTRWAWANADEDTHYGEPVSGSLTLCPSRPDLGRAIHETPRACTEALDGTLHMQCMRQTACPHAQHVLVLSAAPQSPHHGDASIRHREL